MEIVDRVLSLIFFLSRPVSTYRFCLKKEPWVLIAMMFNLFRSKRMKRLLCGDTFYSYYVSFRFETLSWNQLLIILILSTDQAQQHWRENRWDRLPRRVKISVICLLVGNHRLFWLYCSQARELSVYYIFEFLLSIVITKSQKFELWRLRGDSSRYSCGRKTKFLLLHSHLSLAKTE